MATVIVKATERCNSNCYYCDVVRKAGSGSSMPLEVLERVFERADEYLRAHPGEELELLWHGGEPLVLGPAYFRRALELQEARCGSTRGRIAHRMQTNLTCFDEEYVEVFRRLGITSVGTSYDPEPHMRGPGPEIDSGWYNRRFLRALGVLEGAGFGWGMIYVVTRRSLGRPLEVFHFLTNLKPTGGVNFNPVLIYDELRREVAVTPEEYAEFLGAIFPVWWKHRHRYPDVQPFTGLVRAIVDRQRAPGCLDLGVCGHRPRQVVVDPEGRVFSSGNPRDPRHRALGSIAGVSLGAMFEEGASAGPLDTGCAGCRFGTLCHDPSADGGATMLFKDEWCDARRAFVERYLEPVTGSRHVG